MARRDQYIKSKSDFVLRKRHALTSKGMIYENDHMTIVPDDDIFNEDRSMYSDSNFKFRTRIERNEKKKHFGGNWVKPDGEESEFWKEENCSGNVISEETRIVLKPNYSSIKDFAYYGSAQDLIKASVRDVLLKYPAGLYYIGDEHRKIGDKFIVSNEFGIDIWTPNVEPTSVDNPLRYLSASYGQYLEGRTNKFVTNFRITKVGNGCPNSIIAQTRIGNNVFYTYLADDGSHVVLSNGSLPAGEPIIRLPEAEFLKRYDELDDFSKVLLNLDSKPLFKATLDTPYFDGNGYYSSYRNYVWPSIHTEDYSFFTPDITSPLFAGYIEKLMIAARFHDEYDSDNMWRMLTHQSIKNLDWTFTKDNGDEVETIDFDSSRIKAAIELYGRQFDDLRRYANNIKATNAITYDEKNNIPDYFITDAVENNGWDAHHVGPTNDMGELSDVLYTGSTISGKNSSDASVSFLRRLSINSDYINSMKGTKRGIETILGMFGLESGADYSIKEYIAVADRFPSTYDFKTKLPYYDKYYYGEEEEMLSDWPITSVKVSEDDDENYIIPWFSKDNSYPSKAYFQSKGGWKNTIYKNIDLPITSIKRIKANDDFAIYGETLQYLKYATDIDELTALTTTKLFKNAVCYVEDISGILNGYNASPDDKRAILNGSQFSHYFILKNVELSASIGFIDNDFYSCYGWRNIFVDEYDGTKGLTCDGKRVLYLESLKTVETGNNPHAGYGFYDLGEEYLDNYRQIFKHQLENKEFSLLNEEGDADEIHAVEDMGFGDCEQIPVDTKTLVFYDDANTNVTLMPIGSERDDVNWTEGLYANLVNPEGGSKRDEASSFSIINTKRIDIEFNDRNNEYYREYIENVILKYVEQMMPSTAIFSYKFASD